MKYARFEALALAIGLISVVGVVIATPWKGPQVEEIVAQALLFVVLIGAVHWGWKGGTITASLSVLTYLLMRAPLIMDMGLTRDLLTLVLVRTFTYAALGVGGGMLCGHVRYILARLDDNSNIDEQTKVFNQHFINGVLRSMVTQHERHGGPFSLVTLELASSLTDGLMPAKQRFILRAVAGGIRGDVRLVDDVARLDDGRFLLVLPRTAKPGAHVAANRVGAGVRRLLGGRDDAVRVEVLGAAEDMAAIRALCGMEPAPEQSDMPEQATA